MTQQDSDQRVYAADSQSTVVNNEPGGSTPVEERTDDPTVVRTNRRTVDTAPTGATEVHSTRYARRQLVERYGGFYWGADFIGFVVAAFFTMLFLGIVGAI